MSTQGIVSSLRPQRMMMTGSPPPKPATRTLLPALATGGMLWLCFFPVAWGWLAWVALAPLLTLVRTAARPRAIYLSAWASGLVFYWPVLQWMRVADPSMYFTWMSLATYCSLFFPLAIYLLRLLDRRTRLPLILTAPVVWTALEYFRSFFGTGFPWYLVAHSQHDYLSVIQIADVTGTWGISFILVAVNALLCEAFLDWRTGWRRSRIALKACLVGALCALVCGYGAWRIRQTSFEEGPLVALVQGNLPQNLRNNPTSEKSVLAHYTELCLVAANHKPGLIVLPESSLQLRWGEYWPDGLLKDTKTDCRDVARLFRTSTLVGLNTFIRGADHVERRFNSAVLINRYGEPRARYDKIHRVPFGEYVPFRETLPFMNWFSPYDFDYSITSGSGFTRFELEPPPARDKPVQFGVLICYEDSDPDISRPYAGGDTREPTDFLLNISNDGWFEGTSEHEQHLAVCRFRAVECRQPVARAVNMGISALIDSNGRVLAPQTVGEAPVNSGVSEEPVNATIWQVGPDSGNLPTARWQEFKKTAGVILATVPLDPRKSFYARFGDWLPISCWAFLGISLLVAARRRPVSASRDGNHEA
jgi:apolipoprotein N-acyltransferase